MKSKAALLLLLTPAITALANDAPNFAELIRSRTLKGTSSGARAELAPSVPAATAAISVTDYNAGSMPLVPGSLFLIRGKDLAPKLQSFESETSGGSLTTVLDGVRVLLDGQPSFLLQVSPDYIIALAPWNTRRARVVAKVERDRNVIGEASVDVRPVGPVTFSWQRDNVRWAYAVRQNGDEITPEKPATKGENIFVLMTGLGATNPAPPEGRMLDKTYPVTAPVRVSFANGSALNVISAVLSAPGMYWVQVKVPDSLPGGNSTIAVESGGLRSATAMLPVQGQSLSATPGNGSDTGYSYLGEWRGGNVEGPHGGASYAPKSDLILEGSGNYQFRGASASNPGCGRDGILETGRFAVSGNTITFSPAAGSCRQQRSYSFDLYRPLRSFDAVGRPEVALRLNHSAGFAEYIRTMTAQEEQIVPVKECQFAITSSGSNQGECVFQYEMEGNLLILRAGVYTATSLDSDALPIFNVDYIPSNQWVTMLNLQGAPVPASIRRDGGLLKVRSGPPPANQRLLTPVGRGNFERNFILDASALQNGRVALPQYLRSQALSLHLYSPGGWAATIDPNAGQIFMQAPESSPKQYREAWTDTFDGIPYTTVAQLLPASIAESLVEGKVDSRENIRIGRNPAIRVRISGKHQGLPVHGSMIFIEHWRGTLAIMMASGGYTVEQSSPDFTFIESSLRLDQ
jgi:uncharacterized protein (TIGR03437 family)